MPSPVTYRPLTLRIHPLYGFLIFAYILFLLVLLNSHIFSYQEFTRLYNLYSSPLNTMPFNPRVIDYTQELANFHLAISIFIGIVLVFTLKSALLTQVRIRGNQLQVLYPLTGLFAPFMSPLTLSLSRNHIVKVKRFLPWGPYPTDPTRLTWRDAVFIGPAVLPVCIFSGLSTLVRHLENQGHPLVVQ